MFHLRSAYVPQIVSAARPHRTVQVGGGITLVGAEVEASGSKLVDALKEAINQLDQDILIDACADSYSDACRGSSPEVDLLERKLYGMEAEGIVLDAWNILEAAGVETAPRPTQDAKIKKFASCVLKREDKFGGLPRGSLAYCAVMVRAEEGGEESSLPKAHSTQAFRDRWETWKRMFFVFADKYESSLGTIVSTPSDAEVSKYLAKYSDFRDIFISNGGSTTAPSIGEPWALTTKIMVFGGIAVALYVGLQLYLASRVIPH